LKSLNKEAKIKCEQCGKAIDYGHCCYYGNTPESTTWFYLCDHCIDRLVAGEVVPKDVKILDWLVEFKRYLGR